MSGHGHSPVHYEVFSRKTPQSSWTLQMASEERAQAIATAEDMLANRHVAAVKVTKEMFDADSGEFSSLTLLTKGQPEARRTLKLAPETDSVCTGPQDFYSLHARDKIARLLEDWLRRHRVTPFELLHRPDLAERMEASGSELLHVVQKLAVVESQEGGQDLHALMRRWQALIDRAVTRLIEDGRRRLFPDVDAANWLGTIDQLHDHNERAYVLGGSIAAVLAREQRPMAKLEKLLGLARLLAEDLGGREWALQTLEIPVTEIFASRVMLADVLGADSDLGGSMAILTRMAAGREVDLIAVHDAKVARLIPPLTGVLGGYHDLIVRGCFPALSYNISRRLIAELKGPRRLKPHDALAEIETLRALALCMTAAGKEEGQRDDIKDAFFERSKMLVSTDFVESLTRGCTGAADEIDKLIWLCENVAGAMNKRQGARWLISAIGGVKFEREMRDPAVSATQRLQTLAQMQRRVRQVQLSDKDGEEACGKLGHIGGLVAADVHMVAHLLRSSAPPVQKISLLLGFATGASAPLGPVSDQARSEVMKLLRTPEVRQGLVENPQAMAALRPMLAAAGLAA